MSSEPVTVTIGDMVIRGATSASEQGGWNAPSKKVEQGFPFTTFSQQQPKEIQLTAWVSKDEYKQLESLRRGTEPFTATVGDFSLPRAKLSSLEVQSTGDTKSHYEVTFSLSQVRQAQLEDAEINFQTPNGEAHSETPDSPTIGGTTEEEDGDVTDEATDDTGTGTIEGILNSFGGIL